MVYSNIARYMRDTRAVRREATDEQALLAFNELVKTEVPLAVTQSLGAWGIPVRYLCVILLPLMTNMLDYLAVAPLLYSEPRAMAAFAAGAEMPDSVHLLLYGVYIGGNQAVPGSARDLFAFRMVHKTLLYS